MLNQKYVLGMMIMVLGSASLFAIDPSDVTGSSTLTPPTWPAGSDYVITTDPMGHGYIPAPPGVGLVDIDLPEGKLLTGDYSPEVVAAVVAARALARERSQDIVFKKLQDIIFKKIDDARRALIAGISNAADIPDLIKYLNAMENHRFEAPPVAVGPVWTWAQENAQKIVNKYPGAQIPFREWQGLIFLKK